MSRLLILVAFTFITMINVNAQNGFKYISFSGGINILQENSYNFDLEYEINKPNYNSISYGLNGYLADETEVYLGTISYKPALSKNKNLVTKWNFNFNAGHNRSEFIIGLGVGLDFQYYTRSGVIVFLDHQYKALFIGNDFWRNQTSLGLKIPL